MEARLALSKGAAKVASGELRTSQACLPLSTPPSVLLSKQLSLLASSASLQSSGLT